VRVPSVIEYDLYQQPEDCSRAPQGMTMINTTTIAAVMAAMSLGASAFAKTRAYDTHRHR
jgi:hypothetical protein